MGPFDVIETALETNLAPELIANLERGQVPLRLLARLHEQYSQWSGGFRLPPKESHTLRPFISYRAAEGLKLESLYFQRDQSVELGVASRTVKTHLLYAHSLVLHDPLPYHLDFFGPPHIANAQQKHFERLARYFGFLMEMRPLIEDNILFFIDDAPYRAPVILSGQGWPPWGDVKTEGLDVDGLRDLEGLITTMVASGLHGDSLDSYYLNGDSLLPVWDRIAPLLSAGMHAGNRIFSDLLSLQGPRLDDLGFADVVSLRKDSELFGRWRSSLRSAIEAHHSLVVTHGLDFRDDLLHSIREKTRAELADIEKSEFSLLRGAKRDVVVATIAALYLDPSTALLVGSATFLGAIAYDFLNRRSPAAKPFAQHVSVFSERPGR